MDHGSSGNLLERKRKVSLALVLLRTLEVLCAKDENQELLALYNELKPYAEQGLRRKDRS